MAGSSNRRFLKSNCLKIVAPITIAIISKGNDSPFLLFIVFYNKLILTIQANPVVICHFKFNFFCSVGSGFFPASLSVKQLCSCVKSSS